MEERSTGCEAMGQKEGPRYIWVLGMKRALGPAGDPQGLAQGFLAFLKDQSHLRPSLLPHPG